MTQFYLAACATVFLVLPILVSLLRAFGPRWFGAWTAVIIVAFEGWLLVNAFGYFSFEDACETLTAYGSNPPQNTIENCTSDGAAWVFGLLLGGFYALIYYAPFALIYEIARWARRVYLKRDENPACYPSSVRSEDSGACFFSCRDLSCSSRGFKRIYSAWEHWCDDKQS